MGEQEEAPAGAARSNGKGTILEAGRESGSPVWPLTPKIDMTTWPFLTFDRATWTLATATWGPKI